MSAVLVHGDCHGVLVSCSCGQTLIQGQNLTPRKIAEAEQNHEFFCGGADE